MTGFVQRKVINNFCEIAIHFNKVIRIAIVKYIQKICLKKVKFCDEFCDEDQNDLQKHFAKVICIFQCNTAYFQPFIYIYIYTHTHIHTHKHRHTHARTYIYKHTHT